jgi:hypothetical protein
MARIHELLEKVASRVPMRVQRVAAVLIFIPYLVLGFARMFESTIYGIDPRRPHAIVTFLGILFALLFGQSLWRNAVQRDADRRRREIDFEKSQVRDPDADAGIRRDIGMKP